MSALVELYNLSHHDLVAWIVKTYGIALSKDATNQYVGSNQFLNPHRMRREAIATRLRLYRDRRDLEIERVIERIYETDDYRTTLKRYVPVAKEQNVTRRIVDEVASLYDRPALRKLGTDDAAFHVEEKRLNLHELMQEGHRLLTLCNEVLFWQFAGIDDKNKLKIVTPDMFDAIEHPKDRLVEAGILLDVVPLTSHEGEQRARLPHFEIWDDTYRYLVSSRGEWVTETGDPATEPTPNSIGRIPGALLHRREPTTCILDADHGSDIVSCDLGVALLNIMIMRLSKSQGERQPVLQGNLAAMASGQTANGEKPLLLPPEVVASMLDTKTTPEHYLAVKQDKITSVAQTYGMSYEQFTNSETGDSGKLYELRREKLKEIRNESRRRALVNEALVVRLMGFSPDRMRIDYQEQSMPQDAMEKLALMRDKARMGLDSPVKYVMREDPDLSRAEAIAQITENQRDYALIVNMMRMFNIPADALAGNPGATPQQNGANNQPSGHVTAPTPINDTLEKTIPMALRE